MNILIAIHGAHSQPEHRQAQRDTWLRDLEGTADYKYFLGARAGLEGGFTELDALYGGFPDGPIRAGNYGWHTRVLSDKTQMLVEYALERGYDFVFKCDDDTYVRPRLLLASGFDAYDYSGFTEAHSADDIGRYRFALGGTGYWLSRLAMSLIAEHGLNRHRSEDFAVGQLLAAHGIEPHHDARYVPDLERRPTALPATCLTAHKVDPALMRDLYRHDSLSAL